MVRELDNVSKAEVLRRRFLDVEGCSADGHTRHADDGSVRHPMAGTWLEVPVPRKIRDVIEGGGGEVESSWSETGSMDKFSLILTPLVVTSALLSP